MADKIKTWWSDDRRWFCVLVNDGVSQATVSLTPEEAAALTFTPAQSAGMRDALEFYANSKRYEGANTSPLPDDPFQPQELVYRLDVTRDGGRIARKALAAQPPAAPVETEEANYDRASSTAVAWIAFADDGKVRFWTSDERRAGDEKAKGLNLRAFTLAELVSLVSKLPHPGSSAETSGQED